MSQYFPSDGKRGLARVRPERSSRLRLPRQCPRPDPTDRHLSDDVIRAIAQRQGVIGLVLYNGFLEPRWLQDQTIPVTLADQMRQHAEYIANLTGWQHVGIGSDLDSGLGLEESPVEINTVADLYKVGEAVPSEVREAVLSDNWLNFLRRSLPQTS